MHDNDQSSSNVDSTGREARHHQTEGNDMTTTTTNSILNEMGIIALWAMYDGATTRLNDMIAKGYFGSTLEHYRKIRDDYAAELNRRGYEA